MNHLPAGLKAQRCRRKHSYYIWHIVAFNIFVVRLSVCHCSFVMVRSLLALKALHYTGKYVISYVLVKIGLKFHVNHLLVDDSHEISSHFYFFKPFLIS